MPDLTEIAFIDVEADRGGGLVSLGGVRGDEILDVDLRLRDPRSAAEELARFVGDGPIAGHNILEHDLPLLARRPVGFDPGARPVLDTLALSMLAEPDRPSHALEKRRDGSMPDPVEHARLSRDVAARCLARLGDVEDADLAGLYAGLAWAGGQTGVHDLIARTHTIAARDAPRAFDPGPSLEDLCLPEALLDRLCRVHLGHLLAGPPAGAELFSLALALRYVEVRAEDGRVPGPPSAALASRPRFQEMLTRLMGPLCPDHRCPHRDACDVHRPFAVDILERNFELPSFRPHQEDVIRELLDDATPMVVMPTGGGKSLCYQLPAVHGADRLGGLTVVVSPLQALMADQVRSLSERYPPTCFVNSTLIMEERRRNLAGVRTGRYNVLYIGPEQLRNPSMMRLLGNRPPFLWVIDEAHCISQWGHSFRTDYTYLPRAIASIHATTRRPLVGLFTATATRHVKDDITTLVGEGLGVSVMQMDFGSPRENLSYEVLRTDDRSAKRVELMNLLEASPGGSRLVYCSTVAGATETASMLRDRGVDCALYHGRLGPNEKAEQLERFLSGRARTVVATSAFGMGIDKPDIRLVVHHDMPGTLEDYMQEAGRAGRDGDPARCVLLFGEEDLETQFFLRTSSRVTYKDVRYVFKVLRDRARRLAPAGDDGRVDLWVSAEDLFVQENLEEELDWKREALHTKLKLVLYHLEQDGVLERLENRTRAFGVYPLLGSLDEAVEKMPSRPSPAALRVLEYLYDPGRPRSISILDVADETGVAPFEAFRLIQAFTTQGLVGQELVFDVTLARGIARSTRDMAERDLDVIEALLGMYEDDGPEVVLAMRAAAAEAGRRTGAPVVPHELHRIVRALRRQGLVRMSKRGRGRYGVSFDPSFLEVRERLGRMRRTAGAVLALADEQLQGRQGRDLPWSLDVADFVQQAGRLTERLSHEDVVEACLLLHHLDAWHLSDPPVLLDMAMRVRIDPGAQLADLDLKRPRRYLDHQVSMVHMMREYAVLDPPARDRYVRDYFTLTREELLHLWFKGRKRKLRVPVGPLAEQRILEDLTDAQRDAVTATDRAILVAAGPGSGKTHTVVRRIMHLVRARQVRPEEILVLAFNRSACVELRDRLARSLGARARWIQVRTFHSLALRLTGVDLADEGRDRESVLDGAMALAAEILEGEGDPSQAERVRRRVLGGIRHVLVDEYQDLDADQYRLLTALVGLVRRKGGRDVTERSVYVVGDDDQAIYGFRKASVEFLRRFEEEFGARRICLCESFRSNAGIISSCSRFIAANDGRMKSRPEEQVVPASDEDAPDPDAVRVFGVAGPAEHLSAYLAWAVTRSLEVHESRSVAVLARSWSQLDGVRSVLEAGGVEFAIHSRGFRQPLHRRDPCFRLVRSLRKIGGAVDGPATELALGTLARWDRVPEEPAVREILDVLAGLDAERRRASGRLEPTSGPEIADLLLEASRESAALTGNVSPTARVHLSTFHGSKGLEFDKVFVMPHAPGPGDDLQEERRLFYVAMTRARSELVLATRRAPAELAMQVSASRRDITRQAAEMDPARTRYMDCGPAHVIIGGAWLGKAQGPISKLREGDRLAVGRTDDNVQLIHGAHIVCRLSKKGRELYEKLASRVGGRPTATVREVWVHLDRDDQGNVRADRLVVLPTLRFEPEVQETGTSSSD